jgi:hypothetical protein
LTLVLVRVQHAASENSIAVLEAQARSHVARSETLFEKE